VAVPVVHAVREESRAAQCQKNLKAIGLALHSFNQVYGRFPSDAITSRADNGRLLSWRVAILPYLGQEENALYNEFHLDEPWNSPHNSQLLRRMPKVFECPDEVGATTSLTIYQVVVGPRTMFTGGKGVKVDDVTDGTSMTVLVTESSQPVPWTAPEDIGTPGGSPQSAPGSRHPNVIQALFGDGSVREIPKSWLKTGLPALLTRDGGEMVTIP
jgi:hypothetical protein